jgi:prevent-host-death family protein
MHVNVPITEFRRQLKRWLELAQRGEEIVVTDRGTAVARLTGIDERSVVERLVREGVLTLPARPRIPAKDLPKLKVIGEGKQISDYLDDVR